MQGLSVDMDFASVSIFIFKEGSRNLDQWIQLPDGVASLHVPYFEHPILSDLFDAKESGADYFAKVYTLEEKNSWAAKGFELTDYKNLPLAFKTSVLEAPGYAMSITLAKNSGICIPSFIGAFPSAGDVNILKRAGKVFEQAYIRFLDLQKAEAQAREAQIEAAVERVRTQSMAMHKTSDLYKVNEEILSQLNKLKVDGLTGVSIYLVDENDAVKVWDLSSPGNLSNPGNYTIKYDAKKYPVLGGWVETWKTSKEDYFVLDFPKEVLIMAVEEFKEILPEMAVHIKNAIESGKLQHQWNPSGRLSDGLLSIDLIKPPTEDTKSIVTKMAGAFNLAYQRFQDLQKAEAQLREAQIEGALEKVRSRSLAMHKSNELTEVVSILFEKLKELQIPATAVGIAIYIDGSKDLNAFVCGENEAGLVITNYRLPYFNNKIPKDLNNALEKQLNFFVGNYSKEEKNSFYKYVLEHTAEFKHLPEDIKRMIFESPTYTISMVAVKNAVFNINDFEGKVLSGNEVDIIKRFARVFDQAYTRFLDLQKAEAQAREAKIEIAVERIRAKALAMHKSEEILNVAVSLREEMVKLNLQGVIAATIFLEQANGNYRLWDLTEMTDIEDGARLSLDIDFNPDTIDTDLFFLKFLRSTEKYLIVETNKADFERWAAWYRHYDAAGADKFLQYLQTTSITQSWHAAVPLEKGRLKVDFTNPPPKEMEIILPKMAAAFDLAYTRFLDIQKAEAQAREAQIQLALERVRARTMAMQHSDELGEASALLFKQVSDLGIQTWTSGFNIWENGDTSFIGYNPTPTGGIAGSYHIPSTEDPFFINIYEAKKREEDFFVFESAGESLANTYHYMKTLPIIKDVLKGIEDSGFPMPTCQINHCAFFTHGFLLFITLEPYPNAHDIFKRFGKVFEQTYTRFLDLQKAEAQSRESQIELGLERVRARAMGMQNSNELAELVDTV
ncbi:MAG: hypothetical protein SGI96_16185, partial [Bacteroidota bacterium]|nr:hypothetical protein [Bacteroidota bacterium]